jgi:hypothetical protein
MVDFPEPLLPTNAIFCPKKIFNETFLDKYALISCVKEQYDNCQYKLYKVHYSS